MKNQTYAEMQGKEVFDWNKFLNKKDIKQMQWDQAEKLARRWTTCACGNQCDIIPRDTDGAPKDFPLQMLGLEFTSNIKYQNKDQAKLTLIEIEKRSAYLIARFNLKTYFRNLFNKVKNYIK